MAKNVTTENFSRIMNDLRAKIYHPIYLLMGEEGYFIDQISNYIAQNALQPSEREFNQMTVYGENISAKEIDVAARRYPMMSDRQVIIVKEAQQIRKLDDLEPYAQHPVPTTILVVCMKGKSLDKRTAFYKALLKAGEVFESELFKSYDDSINLWIADYLKRRQCTIDYNASKLLVEHLGVELSKIASELDRLQMMLPPNTDKITAADIEKLGVSKDFNSFELCSAFLKKDVQKAHQIIKYFSNTPKSFDIQSTLGAVFSQFAKLFSYQMLRKKYGSHSAIPDADLQVTIGIPSFVIKSEYAPAAEKFTARKTAEIIAAIRSCDMRSKGWGGVTTESNDLLKELAVLILH
jgi:DNA polymerase-3 subunit delta